MKFTIGHGVTIACVVILGFFGLVGYDSYLKNQPDILPEDVVEEAVMEIFENDSIITIPIEVVYEYSAADFKSNGDTTYWFFKSETRNKKGGKVNNTRTIKFPYSHFDFMAAANHVADSTTKNVFIQYFKQISEASYLSYKTYAKKY